LVLLEIALQVMRRTFSMRGEAFDATETSDAAMEGIRDLDEFSASLAIL
jgi:hypothetical protein